ncbi:MAG: hypothetical protein RL033_7551 [Pseudomonadota bacterium]|jgi:succinate dehydrogenase/fumarate reductase cytochrome b subunit
MNQPYEAPRQLSQQAHRISIGVLGFLLPTLTYALAGLRDTIGLAPWQLLGSVSEYYYTGGIAVFVGVLVAMALFLFTYPGYEGFLWDRILGKVAGVAGAGIALFPTRIPDGLQPLSWWRDSTGVIHYTSAVILFAIFAVFSLWLFRRSNISDPAQRTPGKRCRDQICLISGILILLGMAWSAFEAGHQRSIVLPESLAIMAFSVSWLAKGEVVSAAKEKLRGLQAP